MAHLKKSILIHAPVEKVYALARDPNRWATWFVGMSEPEEIRGLRVRPDGPPHPMKCQRLAELAFYFNLA